VFDHLLISVHPRGCYTARSFLERFLSDAKFSVDATSRAAACPAARPIWCCAWST
jgi:magnesium transporter